MEADDRGSALDLIQAEAGATDEYAAIASDILEEIRERFNLVPYGRFERTTTAWPRHMDFVHGPNLRGRAKNRHAFNNLRNSLSVAISRFLENPTSWDGEPTGEQKRDIIDQIKATATQNLKQLSRRRLRQQPQPQWQTAYGYRGTGSTRDRRDTVEAIYARWVPIPSSIGNPDTQEFLNEVKTAVLNAIEDARREAVEQRSTKKLNGGGCPH